MRYTALLDDVLVAELNKRWFNTVMQPFCHKENSFITVS